MSQKYPIGIETFSKIIEGKFAYVDKTDIIYKLIQSGNHYVFLSRPRRFGKSLMLSTMQAYFEGRKELFKELWLGRQENVEWTCRAVFRLNFVRTETRPDSLRNLISTHLSEWEQIYGKDFESAELSDRFASVVKKAYAQTGEKVVILIDEYDKVLVNTLHTPEVHAEMKAILKSVFSVLKDSDSFIQFAMLTGVSKFSKLSLFSDLNNLKDISFSDKFSTICGITEDELRHYFAPGIETFAEQWDTDFENIIQILRENYDGYHFSKKCPDIYNPFSLINALDDCAIEHRWFESGTPTFLVEKIKNSGDSIHSDLNPMLSGFALSNMNLNEDDITGLLYQTGYLTIKKYLPQADIYQLGIPNREVETGLYQHLLPLYSGRNITQNSAILYRLSTAIQECRIDDMMTEIKALLASIPYELTENKREIYYENNLFLIFKLLGCDVHAEFRTSQGRIDTLLQTPDYIYILEFKLDGNADDALRQIEERNYPLPFTTDSRKILCIGVNFSKETRTIENWEKKQLLK